ncbi:hypothetical protein GQX73_g8746 [Xylaria multiplex]|uniref:TFIIS-type domain-containing protein n=1 Tax=Xylaria multiplex TaxID=323545 RepID=A0A7C8INZ0_9PEZI|nr:hypothetical protein GQX73_g8746 [Xylaria multiplex]
MLTIQDGEANSVWRRRTTSAASWPISLNRPTVFESHTKTLAQRNPDTGLDEENMKKAQVPMVEESINDSLECSACKKKMVSYSQAQTRSADEPMTAFLRE